MYLFLMIFMFKGGLSEWGESVDSDSYSKFIDPIFSMIDSSKSFRFNDSSAFSSDKFYKYNLRHKMNTKT